MEKIPIKQLQKKADMIRREVVTVCMANGAGHIAPSLSCVDILTALYYSEMNITGDPQNPDRDRLIFSKAHGCYGLYAILADIGYVPQLMWKGFYKDSRLSGCIEYAPDIGIEAGCGALGHGLPMAVGLAWGARIQKKSYRVFCIIGDGEMQEGSNWEALMLAVKYGLDNLILIVDANGLQAMDFLENVMTPRGLGNKDLEKKLRAFGMHTVYCNGHNPEIIAKTIRKLKRNVPHAIIAETVKGYGLTCMENVPKFHFRLPTPEEMTMGCRYE